MFLQISIKFISKFLFTNHRPLFDPLSTYFQCFSNKKAQKVSYNSVKHGHHNAIAIVALVLMVLEKKNKPGPSHGHDQESRGLTQGYTIIVRYSTAGIL